MGRQCFDGRDSKRKSRGEIVTVAREQPHVGATAPSLDAEAVMFDFVNPAGTGRRSLRRREQAGLDNSQPGSGTLTQRHNGLFIGMTVERVESEVAPNIVA